jgi:hypothetical protein
MLGETRLVVEPREHRLGRGGDVDDSFEAATH